MSPTNQLPGGPGSPPNNRPVASTTLLQSTVAVVQHPRNDESWVEVSSQPSSSSVSSIGDEIVTTGLRVSSSYRPRRRRAQQRSSAPSNATPTTSVGRGAAGGSSQEEYDETESEEDHFLTSSTDDFFSAYGSRQVSPPQASPQTVRLDSSDDEDDDENTTAVGWQPAESFRPQPNAFSHPPSHLFNRNSTNSTTPHGGRRPSFSRRSYSRADRRNLMSANYQADNDAALRASLSTLLRCAAAARSLPRDGEKELNERPPQVASNQPMALRFASENELMAPSPPPAASRVASQPATTSSKQPSTSAPVATAGEKIKRAATPPVGQKPPRATKKKRTARSEDALISPTLLTWVVSAGVVVLVSVVGFGAGYVIGREVGRRETLGSFSGAGNVSAVSDGGSCGREAIRSSGGTLRRFRWGTGMGKSISA